MGQTIKKLKVLATLSLGVATGSVLGMSGLVHQMPAQNAYAAVNAVKIKDGQKISGNDMVVMRHPTKNMPSIQILSVKTAQGRDITSKVRNYMYAHKWYKDDATNMYRLTFGDIPELKANSSGTTITVKYPQAAYYHGELVDIVQTYKFIYINSYNAGYNGYKGADDSYIVNTVFDKKKNDGSLDQNYYDRQSNKQDLGTSVDIVSKIGGPYSQYIYSGNIRLQWDVQQNGKSILNRLKSERANLYVTQGSLDNQIVGANNNWWNDYSKEGRYLNNGNNIARYEFGGVAGNATSYITQDGLVDAKGRSNLNYSSNGVLPYMTRNIGAGVSFYRASAPYSPNFYGDAYKRGVTYKLDLNHPYTYIGVEGPNTKMDPAPSFLKSDQLSRATSVGFTQTVVPVVPIIYDVSKVHKQVFGTSSAATSRDVPTTDGDSGKYVNINDTLYYRVYGGTSRANVDYSSKEGQANSQYIISDTLPSQLNLKKATLYYVSKSNGVKHAVNSGDYSVSVNGQRVVVSVKRSVMDNTSSWFNSSDTGTIFAELATTLNNSAKDKDVLTNQGSLTVLKNHMSNKVKSIVWNKKLLTPVFLQQQDIQPKSSNNGLYNGSSLNQTVIPNGGQAVIQDKINVAAIDKVDKKQFISGSTVSELNNSDAIVKTKIDTNFKVNMKDVKVFVRNANGSYSFVNSISIQLGGGSDVITKIKSSVLNAPSNKYRTTQYVVQIPYTSAMKIAAMQQAADVQTSSSFNVALNNLSTSSNVTNKDVAWRSTSVSQWSQNDQVTQGDQGVTTSQDQTIWHVDGWSSYRGSRYTKQGFMGSKLNLSVAIPSEYTINRVRVVNKNTGADVTGQFNISRNGQNVVAQAKQSLGWSEQYELKVYTTTNTIKNHGRLNIQNTVAHSTLNGVGSEILKWTDGDRRSNNLVTATRRDTPTKSVFLHNTVTDVNGKSIQDGTMLDYRLTQQLGDISKRELTPTSSFVIKDTLDKHLVANLADVKVLDDTGQDVTGYFNMSIRGNVFTASANSAFLSNIDRYSGHRYTAIVAAKVPAGTAKKLGGVFRTDNVAYVSLNHDNVPTNYVKTYTPYEVPDKKVYNGSSVNVTNGLNKNIDNNIVQPTQLLTYDVSQTIGAPGLDTGFVYSDLRFQDDIPSGVTFKSWKVVTNKGQDVSNLFSNKGSDNHIDLQMSESGRKALNSYRGTRYHALFTVSVDDTDTVKYLRNQAVVTTNDQNPLTPVSWIVVTPRVTKTESSSTFKNTTSGKLKNPIDPIEYQVKQTIPGSDKSHAQFRDVRLKNFLFVDDVDARMTINKMYITDETNMDRTGWFVNQSRGNNVKWSATHVNASEFYGHTYTLHIQTTPKGENTSDIQIVNKASTPITNVYDNSPYTQSVRVPVTVAIPMKNNPWIHAYVKPMSADTKHSGFNQKNDWVDNRLLLSTHDQTYAYALKYNLPNNRNWTSLKLGDTFKKLQKFGQVHVLNSKGVDITNQFKINQLGKNGSLANITADAINPKQFVGINNYSRTSPTLTFIVLNVTLKDVDPLLEMAELNGAGAEPNANRPVILNSGYLTSDWLKDNLKQHGVVTEKSVNHTEVLPPLSIHHSDGYINGEKSNSETK